MGSFKKRRNDDDDDNSGGKDHSSSEDIAAPVDSIASDLEVRGAMT